MLMLRPVILVTSFAAYAVAQSISDQCIAAFGSVAANPDASSCLSIGSLLSLATQSSSSSVVPVINNWLTSLCGQPACSNATLAAVTQNITSGCATDLQSIGFTSDLTPTITQYVQQYYPTVRKVACLKSGNDLCITQTLTNVEGVTGTLSLSNLQSNTANITRSLSTLPNNITCTDCLKASYNVVVQDVPALGSDLKSAAQDKCGAAFVDGASVSGVSQSASGSSASSASGAVGLLTFLTDGLTLGGVSGLLALSALLV